MFAMIACTLCSSIAALQAHATRVRGKIIFTHSSTLSRDPLPLLVLLRHVRHRKSYRFQASQPSVYIPQYCSGPVFSTATISSCSSRAIFTQYSRTRGQALLQFIRLFRVLKHQCVQEPMTSDLELDLVGVAFYVSGCSGLRVSMPQAFCCY